jgi:hypothetical protein
MARPDSRSAEHENCENGDVKGKRNQNQPNEATFHNEVRPWKINPRQAKHPDDAVEPAVTSAESSLR